MLRSERHPKPPMIVTIGGLQYLVSPRCHGIPASAHRLRSEAESALAMPMTLIDTRNALFLNADWLNRTIGTMLRQDDVFNRGFLSTVVFHSVEKESQQSLKHVKSAKAVLESVICEVYGEIQIPSGPYVLLPSGIHEVYRLYHDTHSAFMYGMTRSGEGTGSYEQFDSGLIPVPSRLYFGEPSPLLPLNGARVGIKDIFDISGVSTSAGSRAFEVFHGNSKSSAASVQHLIDMGAVIVGKTKTTQFASGEYAQDWVDYQCPFNPRGDGYFDPSCSSAGSAAALAAYKWLDFSIGTDTLGSMTEPAAAQGLYGVRPTHGSVALDGIYPASLALDTPGYFSRSIENLRLIGNAWYGENCWKFPVKPPEEILVPRELFKLFPGSKCEVMMRFIDDVEKTTGVHVHDFDVAALWNAQAPPNCTRPVTEYLSKTLAQIYLYDSYRGDDKFQRDYWNKMGREPYANPMVRFKWKLAAKVSQADYGEACKEMATFRRFVRKHVFKDNNIMILPGGEGEVVYRDDYHGPPEKYGPELQGFGFHHKVYSCLGGLPQIVVPVGQHQILSKNTHDLIWEPISVIIVGPAGSDIYLMDLIQQVLKASFRPLEVEVGANAFKI